MLREIALGGDKPEMPRRTFADLPESPFYIPNVNGLLEAGDWEYGTHNSAGNVI